MKVLVTGGTGFIGSNLSLELEKQDYDVSIVDKISETKNIEGFKGNILDIDISKPFEIKDKFGVIFHQAAITDPRFEDLKEQYRQNVEGFKFIIKLAQKNKAKLVYASSSAIYGNGSTPMKEDQDPDLQTVYAKSKWEMDKLAEKFFDKMHMVGLRYFNVFGPREEGKGRPASMIYHLGKQMIEGKKPRIFKWGEQKRDHIYVKDVVLANIKALTAPSGIYNVGTGIATSFNDLVKTLNEVLKTKLEPEYFDTPYKIYQNNTQADTKKAEKVLVFKAKYTLKNGIKDYQSWIK